MAIALDTFIKQLEESGVISRGKLENFIPPKAAPKDAQELARELVTSQQLTKYQAMEIWQGRAKSLILGNYTILDKIGEGGMGQVYKAQHRRMNRIVALKMLPSRLTKDALAAARFQREVEAAAKLSHPNIVAAHDADEANGVNFLVMEYVEGIDLSALVKRNGPCPVDNAVSYILQAARGLEFAHRKGVIHRDIKPGNLLIDGEGTVKILDMGLARIESSGNAATQAELTGTGTIMGTVDYMAPEQALSTRHADVRADIYSLGCTLHYLLTGQPIYDGETLTAKLLAHQGQPIPSLCAARPEVPEAIDEIYRRMVAKRLEDRYQSMSDVVAEVERCGGASALAARADSPLDASTENSELTFLNEGPRPTTHRLGQSHTRQETRKSTSTKMGKTATAAAGTKSRQRLVLGLGAGATIVTVILAAVFLNRETMQQGVDKKAATKLEVAKKQPPSKSGAGASTAPPTASDLSTRNHARQFDHARDSAGTSAPAETMADPTFQAWMQVTAKLPVREQLRAVAKKLQQLNPGFDGLLTPGDNASFVTELTLDPEKLLNIAPLSSLVRLESLTLYYQRHGATSQLVDLSPLRGLSLKRFSLRASRVSDLSPLVGMPLEELRVPASAFETLEQVGRIRTLKKLDVTTMWITDFAPLRGLQLEELQAGNARVADLSPLEGMPLVALSLGGSFTDLAPLTKSPLRSLYLSICDSLTDYSPLATLQLEDFRAYSMPLRDLNFLRGSPVKHIGLNATLVTDLSPLRETQVEDLSFEAHPLRDPPVLRQIPSLKLLNGKPIEQALAELDAAGKTYRRVSPGQWTDALATVKLPDDAVAGEWRLKDGELACAGQAGKLCVLPVEPTGDYDFELSAKISPQGLRIRLPCNGTTTVLTIEQFSGQFKASLSLHLTVNSDDAARQASKTIDLSAMESIRIVGRVETADGIVTVRIKPDDRPTITFQVQINDLDELRTPDWLYAIQPSRLIVGGFGDVCVRQFRVKGIKSEIVLVRTP